MTPAHLKKPPQVLFPYPVPFFNFQFLFLFPSFSILNFTFSFCSFSFSFLFHKQKVILLFYIHVVMARFWTKSKKKNKTSHTTPPGIEELDNLENHREHCYQPPDSCHRRRRHHRRRLVKCRLHHSDASILQRRLESFYLKRAI